MASRHDLESNAEKDAQPSAAPHQQWREGMLFHNRKRSRLSNERTFLSWVRTSLALITIGFVVQRFELFLAQAGIAGKSPQLLPMVKWVPLLFFFLGGIIILLGTYEFFRVRYEITQENEERKSRLRDVLVVLTLLFLLAVVALFLIEMP